MAELATKHSQYEATKCSNSPTLRIRQTVQRLHSILQPTKSYRIFCMTIIRIYNLLRTNGQHSVILENHLTITTEVILFIIFIYFSHFSAQSPIFYKVELWAVYSKLLKYKTLSSVSAEVCCSPFRSLQPPGATKEHPLHHSLHLEWRYITGLSSAF